MRKLLNTYLKPYYWQIILILVLQSISAMASLYLPTLNAAIIDNGVTKGDISAIWQGGVWMLAVALLQICAQILAIYFAAKVAISLGYELMNDLFVKVLSFSKTEISQFSAGSIVTRSTNDVRQIMSFLFITASMLINSPLIMTGGIIMSVREDPGLSWLILFAVLALVILFGVIISLLVPHFRNQQLRIDKLNQILREQITGRKVIRAFTQETFENQRFSQANKELTETSLRIGILINTMFPISFFIMNVSVVGVVFFGAGRIDTGNLQVGQMIAFTTYLMQILISVAIATMMTMIGPRAAISARRITEILDTVPEISDFQKLTQSAKDTTLTEDNISQDKASCGTKLAAKPDLLTAEVQELCFNDVSFSYSDASEATLKEISFKAKAGSQTAIVGSTGSGKSSLIALITRFIEATSGTVQIDGQNINEIPLAELWQKTATVPQNPYLFTGTVRSNLLFGKETASDEELWRALEIAQAKDFIAALPQGLDSEVAQGGSNFSGGQKQRLAIARALVKQAAIYIFDDSFSALDVATEAKLRAQLNEYTKSAIVITIAQRISSIQDCAQILVLENGHIAGRGTHEELLENCEVYGEMVDSQKQTVEG